MLQANKASVVAGWARQTLALRQMELQYWMEVLKKFGTLASFLGGFASSVLSLQTDVKGASGFRLIFSLTAVGAMGFNFLLLALCTTCSIWGPGKALVGDGEASFRVVRAASSALYRRLAALRTKLEKPLNATRKLCWEFSCFLQVIGLMEEVYGYCVVLFRLGTLCYFMATVFAAFCLFSCVGAMTITGVLFSVGYVLLKHSAHLRRLFVPSRFSSGALYAAPALDIASQMTLNSDRSLGGRLLDPSFGARV